MQVCLSGVAPSITEVLAVELNRELFALGKGIVEAGLKGELKPRSKGLVTAGLCNGPGVPITPLPLPAEGFRFRGAGRTRQMEVTFS
jgi:hypothetical protein